MMAVDQALLDSLGKDSDEESVDLDDLPSENKMTLFWCVFLGFIRGFYLALLAKISFWFTPSQIGKLTKPFTRVQVSCEGSECTIYLPRTMRIRDEILEVYRPEGDIIEVMIKDEDIEEVWTQPFVEASGPSKNFFGIPVTPSMIKSGLPKESKMFITLKGQKPKSFGPSEFIDIFHWEKCT